MTNPIESAAQRLNTFGQESPDAVRLARLASLAVQLDPPLLRRLRQELLPDVDVGVEGDLWFSPLVESRGARGVVLDQHVVDVLREDLAGDGELLSHVIDITNDVQRSAPESIRLEITLNALALRNEGDVTAAIDEALRPALRAIREGGNPAREVAQWAMRALPRIHPRVRRSEAAISLLIGASAVLDRRRILKETPDTTVLPESIAWILPSGALEKPISIGVELVERGLRFLEPGGASATIQLPDITPLLVSLSWVRRGTPTRCLVETEIGRTVDLEVDVATVTIRTIAGDEYLLQREALLGDRGLSSYGDVAPADTWSYLRLTSEPNRSFELEVLTPDRRWPDDRHARPRRSLDEITNDVEFASSVAKGKRPDRARVDWAKLIGDPEVIGEVTQSEGIVLLVDSETARYPWEILPESPRGESLSLKLPMLRQFSGDEMPLTTDDPPLTRGRALIATVSETDSGNKDLESEVRIVQAVLRDAGFATQVMIGTTRKEVLDALQAREYRVLHFSGHGTTVSGELAQEWLAPGSFRRMSRVPELVFMHVDASLDSAALLSEECMGAGTRALIIDGDYGVKGSFVEKFYEGLVAGRSVGTAVLEARRALAPVGRGSLAAVVQCYGVPGYRLEARRPTITADELAIQESQSAAPISYGPWVLEILGTLSLAFHVGVFEGKRRLAGAERERFYGAKSPLERNDFHHIRYNTEGPFVGGLSDFMKRGPDPFTVRPDQEAELQSWIDGARKEDGLPAYQLSLALARFIGFASPEEREGVRDLPAPDTVKEERSLRLWLSRLEGESLFRAVARYQAPFHRWFQAFPTTLQDSITLPDYAKRFITRWLKFGEVAEQQRKARMDVGLEASSAAVASFQLAFPEIRVSLEEPIEATKGLFPSAAKEEPESRFSLPVAKYLEAIVQLERLLLPALEREWKSRQEFTDLGSAATSVPPLPA